MMVVVELVDVVNEFMYNCVKNQDLLVPQEVPPGGGGGGGASLFDDSRYDDDEVS